MATVLLVSLPLATSDLSEVASLVTVCLTPVFDGSLDATCSADGVTVLAVSLVSLLTVAVNVVLAVTSGEVAALTLLIYNPHNPPPNKAVASPATTQCLPSLYIL